MKEQYMAGSTVEKTDQMKVASMVQSSVEGTVDCLADMKGK
jgi:hypothetical protein